MTLAKFLKTSSLFQTLLLISTTLLTAFHPSSQPIKFHQTGHITDCLTNQAFNSTLRPKTTLKRPKPLPPPDEFHVALNNNTTYKNIHNTAYNNINNKIVDNLLDNDNFLRNTNLFNKSLLIDNDDNNNDNTWIATADKQPPQIPRDAITFLTHVGEGVFSQVSVCVFIFICVIVSVWLHTMKKHDMC